MQGAGEAKVLPRIVPASHASKHVVHALVRVVSAMCEHIGLDKSEMAMIQLRCTQLCIHFKILSGKIQRNKRSKTR